MNRRKYIKYFLYAFVLIVIFFFGRIFNFIKIKFFNYTKIAQIYDFNEKDFLKINEREIIVRKKKHFI
jgi:hypothetical protein